jgi:O-methyltransferase
VQQPTKQQNSHHPTQQTQQTFSLPSQTPTNMSGKDLPHFNAAGYQYIRTIGNRPNALRDRLRAETTATFGQSMLTTPEQCEFMRFLVQVTNSSKGVEVGTFTGMSSLALTEGFRNKETSMLYTLDNCAEFTNVAERYWKEAGVCKNVKLMMGDAVESLGKLASDAAHVGTFDFAFLDGRKPDYLHYIDLCLKLLRPGGFIIVDNVMWSGQVADIPEASMDECTWTLRQVAETLRKDPRVDVCMLPVSDGISLVYKR